MRTLKRFFAKLFGTTKKRRTTRRKNKRTKKRAMRGG